MRITFNTLNRPHTFLAGKGVRNQCIQRFQNEANRIMVGYVCKEWQS